jgi:hypothetical protein
MKPIDFRNATWADLQGRLSRQRASAYGAWILQGPGTTAEVARKSGISILTLRPRTTELIQLGLICLADAQPRSREGVYRIRTAEEIGRWLAARREDATPRQVELAFR